MPFPNGEDRADFIDRSVAEFYEILSLSGGRTPVVICHGGNIMAIMSHLTGKDYFDFMIGNVGGHMLSLTLENERELWIYHTIALTFSIILDRVVGDPYSLPHPIRWIGNYIALLEERKW